jgi:hypothetical protein
LLSRKSMPYDSRIRETRVVAPCASHSNERRHAPHEV